MPITALYAAALAVLFVILSFRTIGVRRAAKVEIGDGNNPELLRRMRVHANFAEYVPLALILMALAESLKLPALWLHTIGATLIVGRYVHAYALSQTPHILPLRVFGMVATLSAIMAAAAACLLLSIPII
jgi:uncharacterized protein